ncbi:phosphatase PAP2 family protein [Hymenobacter busanensis]|uniref:phosphatase PAP2 family protein n=1 Tax=Hymenobacter busanensis TaxID=2607656 RepID=UPI001366DE5D|nr:phosphatase PAP2 family protein [Hymenobacter busanensis]QHJ09504.1 phosphatase PAP2 family protein [Hymenobacter busanensis]
MAAAVSGLGHPLLTAVGFVGFAAFRRLEDGPAVWVVGLVAGGVVLPVAAWSYWQVRRGHYTNFDVSVREQRYSIYPPLLGLLGGATLLVGGLSGTEFLRPGLVAATGLLALCYLLNFRLKVSLHAALSFFLAGCLTLLSGPLAAGVALAVASLVAASRLVLGRHTAPELLAGAFLGLGAAGLLAGWEYLAPA